MPEIGPICAPSILAGPCFLAWSETAGFEVGNGFHLCVYEKAESGLLMTDTGYRNHSIL